MRKPAFCICVNKGADQLGGSRAADQRLCFCYIKGVKKVRSAVHRRIANHLKRK